MLAQERYEELKQIMIEIAHLNEQEFSTRHSPYPVVNGLIALQMRNEGYSCTEIGKACGRDHSTVSYMIGKISAIIKERNPSWRSILRLWDAFQIKITTEFPNRKDTLEGVRKDIINRVLSLPKNDRIEILLAIKDSITPCETSTMQNQRQ